MLAVAIWGRAWKVHTIRVLSDNTAAVVVINNQTSPVIESAHLLRCLAFFTAHYQCDLEANHIPGQHNTWEQSRIIPYATPIGSSSTLTSSKTTGQATNHGVFGFDITALDRAMDRYFESGLASSTVRTYNTEIKHYSLFCDQLNIQATPTTEPLLCRFITHFVNINISYNTMGVRQLHILQEERMPAIGDMLRFNQVLKGIKICPVLRHRYPITPDALRRIKAAWEKEGLNQDKLMLWKTFTICFFGFLRSGEICSGADGLFDPTSDLMPQEIEIDSIENPHIRLKHSKTDLFREEGSDIFVSRMQNELCPVLAVLA